MTRSLGDHVALFQQARSFCGAAFRAMGSAAKLWQSGVRGAACPNTFDFPLVAHADTYWSNDRAQNGGPFFWLCGILTLALVVVVRFMKGSVAEMRVLHPRVRVQRPESSR